MGAPLVGVAGQLPKLDLYFLLRRFVATHGGGLLLDTKASPPPPPSLPHPPFRMRCWWDVVAALRIRWRAPLNVCLACKHS